MSGVPLETCLAFSNFGIINSITKLHLVGISTESNINLFPVQLMKSGEKVKQSHYRPGQGLRVAGD